MVAYGATCLIDGSHWGADDFNISLIRYAVSKGFEIDEEQFEWDVVLLGGEDVVAEDELLDIYEALTDSADQAVDYLNDLAPDGSYYYIEDNSLFFEVGAGV
jgi:hypothetical protein